MNGHARPPDDDRQDRPGFNAFVFLNAVVDSGLWAVFDCIHQATFPVLLKHLDKRGQCFPTLQTIARESGICRESAQDAIRDFDAVGLFKKHSVRAATMNNPKKKRLVYTAARFDGDLEIARTQAETIKRQFIALLSAKTTKRQSIASLSTESTDEGGISPSTTKRQILPKKEEKLSLGTNHMNHKERDIEGKGSMRGKPDSLNCEHSETGGGPGEKQRVQIDTGEAAFCKREIGAIVDGVLNSMKVTRRPPVKTQTDTGEAAFTKLREQIERKRAGEK